MRDPKRLDNFYDDLKTIHKQYVPDWRFGQFISNVLGYVQSKHGDIFFPEENKMIEYIREYFEGNNNE